MIELLAWGAIVALLMFIVGGIMMALRADRKDRNK